MSDRTEAESTAAQRGYTDPIVAGVMLGLVLLATIVIAGRGLGASGAFAAAAAKSIATVAPDAAPVGGTIAEWNPVGSGGIFGEWLVIELLAVAVGAWLSATIAGRSRATEGDDRSQGRLFRAVAGGVCMGVGARLAHGCTSGLGLTGGALLSTGAWLFIPVAFASAFAVAAILRRFRVVMP